MDMVKPFILVGLGSALGGMGRYGVSLAMARRFGGDFPVGTMVANVTGCFLIGLAAAYTVAESRSQLSASAQQFLMIGALGGYTTFSSFSLQTLQLIKGGQPGWAVVNIGLSVVLCMAGVWLGTVVGGTLNR